MNCVVCLSDTGSSCHVTVMGSLIILVNKIADWNVPVSYIKIHVTLQCIVVSALKKTSKVNTILKMVIFKHSVILFRCSMICRWPEPWNFKTSHFHLGILWDKNHIKIFCSEIWVKVIFGWPLTKLCVTSPFSINFRCQIENQVSDYRLLGASSLMAPKSCYLKSVNHK